MRADGFIGHVVFWDQPLSLEAARLLQRHLAPRRDDRHDPAAAARLGVADRGRRPGRRAADRHPPRVAAREPRPRGRRPAVDGPARRVGARLARRSSTRSGAGSSTAATAFRCWSRATASLGWDARRIRDRGWPVLCEVMTNVLWCLARVAAGEPSITPAIVDRLWDERRGLFLDEVQPGGARPDVSTWAALSPLALPDLPEEIGHRLVDRAPARPEALLARLSPALGRGRPSRPSSPTAARAGSCATGAGPTWVNAAWMLWLGMRRLGYEAEAAHMAERLRRWCCARACASTTTRSPGEGLGARDFAWTSLILEMAEPR